MGSGEIVHMGCYVECGGVRGKPLISGVIHALLSRTYTMYFVVAHWPNMHRYFGSSYVLLGVLLTLYNLAVLLLVI